jgi:hypothetical protein
MEDCIHIRRSRKRSLMMLALFGLFQVISVLLLFKRNFDAGSWVLAGVFALCTLVFLVQFMDSKPRISLRPDGIVSVAAPETIIPWDIIQDSEAKRMGKSQYILLHTTEDDEWFKSMSQSAMKLMQSAGSRKYVFHAHNLDRSAHEIANVMLEVAKIPAEERAAFLRAKNESWPPAQ